MYTFKKANEAKHYPVVDFMLQLKPELITRFAASMANHYLEKLLPVADLSKPIANLAKLTPSLNQ